MKLPSARTGFENLIPAAKDALTRLGRVLVTSTVAGASWLNLGGAALAGPSPGSSPPAPAPTASLLIKDRAKKAAKLVLKLTDARGELAAQHRSHSSHRSHASHYSSRSAPRESRPRSSPSPTVVDVESLAQQVIVTIDKVDASNRTFAGKDELDTMFQFVFRTSTKVYVASASGSLQERNGDGLSLLIGQKVRVAWKYSEDAKKKRLATMVTPVS